MKAYIAIVSLLGGGSIHAQYWADAGVVIDHVGEVGRFHFDSIHNKLYSTGAWVEDYGQPGQSVRYVMKDETGWSLSVPVDNMIYTVANYHDTLYMGGDFIWVDGQFMYYAARRVNGVWEPCGTFNFGVRRFEVIDDELYVIGAFTTIDGHPCQGVAKWVGSGWECVGELGASFCLPVDITEYQGRLVLSGTIHFGNEVYDHVVQFVDGEWIPVGPYGILGGLSGGGQLQVYQGELYVGGLIPLNAGNAGYCLQKWNGSVWSQVGEGLQDDTGGSGWTIKVRDLLVHDGKLFVCGGFGYAGHVHAPRIATWDGVEWCSVGGDFGEDHEVTAMAFYNDTLYIGCGPAVLDGQPITGIAQFVAPEFENHCSGDVAVAERASRTFNAWWADGNLHVHGVNEGGTVQCFAADGRIVLVDRLQPGHMAGVQVLNLGSMATGIYVLVAPSGERSTFLLP